MKGNMASSNQKGFLDVLRIAASLAVVLFHILTSAVVHGSDLSPAVQNTATSVAYILRWFVDVFFIITGYIWLNREKSCSFSRVWKNIRRFALVLLTIGYGFAVLERVFGAGFSPSVLFLALGDVFRGTLWDHMWYLYALIGVYLVLPVFKPFFESQSTRSLCVLTALLWVFTIGFSAAEIAWGYSFPVSLPIASPMFFVCIGGLLSRLSIPRRTAFPALAAFAVCCVLIFMDGFVVFNPVLTSIAAVSIFLTGAALLADAQAARGVKLVSENTFGIYLFHPVFINVLVKMLHFNPLRQAPVLCAVLTAMVVFAASFLLTYLARKIGFVKKYIL